VKGKIFGKLKKKTEQKAGESEKKGGLTGYQ